MMYLPFLKPLRRLLSIGLLLGILSAPLRADDLDDTMAGYLHAVRNSNSFAFLHCFSPNHSWRFFSYRAGTSRIVTSTSFSYEETQEQFDKHGGLYAAFFGGTSQYRYSARVSRYPLSSWIRTADNYRLPEAEGTSFVNWTKEDGHWTIQSIGDDAP